MYTVKEIFHTLQGEGAQAGRAAVFCRFAGCNLACSWCDTDFAHGAAFGGPTPLAAAIAARWPAHQGDRFVVLTGGEPLLQVDAALLEALHTYGFEIAVETNGTRAVPPGIDWVCVSPKAGVPLVATTGDELKFVYPQFGVDPEAAFGRLAFGRFSLQPMDGPRLRDNMARAVAYCMEHPRWRLSLQTHKVLGIA